MKAKIYVYRNLQQDTWSLMHRGIVKWHADRVVLTDVEFRVRPAGRARVLRERRKNVHAFACGYHRHTAIVLRGNPVEVTYNPYHGGYFYRKDNGRAVTHASWVELTPSGQVFAYHVR